MEQRFRGTPVCVGERFAIVWGWNLDSSSLEFVKSIQPEHFLAQAKQTAEHLATQDAKERQLAALAARIHYGHSLESFFALMCAAVQSPHCPSAWLSLYKTWELRNLVQSLVDQRPLYSAWLPLGQERRKVNLTIVGVSEIVHRGISKSGAPDWISKRFGEAWLRLAEDFLDPHFQAEYNCIKHGLRVRLGGHTIRFGEERIPGQRADTLTEIGGSEYGATVPELHPQLGKDSAQYLLKTRSNNWLPERLLDRINLVAVSMHNIRAFLACSAGVDDFQFRWPSSEDAFEQPWSTDSELITSQFDWKVDPNWIKPLSSAQIRQAYIDRMRPPPFDSESAPS